MKTLPIDKLIPLGFINKTHGFQGELSLAIHEDFSLSIDQFKSHFLFILLDGLPVPFFVENIREKANGVLVKFENVSDEFQAKKLVGKKVHAEKLKLNATVESEPSWFDFIGYAVIDKSYGDLGAILEIQELPMQFLASCKVNDKEVLFPLHEEIIIDIDDNNKIIQIDLPDGLLDVYLSNEDNN